MPRFTPATETALLAAGWFEGRALTPEQMNDWLVVNWLPDHRIPQGYSRISLRAWQVLNEFGGLSIPRAGGEDGVIRSVIFNPLCAQDGINPARRLDVFAWLDGGDLFPLGVFQLHNHEMGGGIGVRRSLMMSSDGRIFVHESGGHGYCLGQSIEQALEKIVAGERGESYWNSMGLKYDQIEETYKTIHAAILRREKQMMSGQWPDQPTTHDSTRNNKFFEITDWDAEAQRVCQAFEIEQPCVFVGPVKQKFLRLRDNPLSFNDGYPPLGDNLFLNLFYCASDMRFRICDESGKQHASATIGWRGLSYTANAHNFEVARRIGKGLFNLGLLTPEIEEKLTKNFTHHEILEWQLEFEQTP